MENIKLFISSVKNRVPADIAVGFFKDMEIDSNIYAGLIEATQDLPIEEKMRVYGSASKAATGEIRELLEKKSMHCVREMVENGTTTDTLNYFSSALKKDKCLVSLPLRVNWGGTWTDTPPYCLENGGAVVNASVNINNIAPVKVSIEKLDEPKVVLEYFDSGNRGEFYNMGDLSNLSNPLEPFPLLKSALMVSGVIPMPDEKPVCDMFKKLGGGLFLSTGVVGIPKGSGLGTSSILLAACIKALYQFTERVIEDTEIYRRVLLAEQLMGTGGGWQDQAGGLTKGIKLVTAGPGCRQEIKVKQLKASKKFMDELNERFCLVYSGKRRLGRTILREVMGGYIRSDPLYINILGDIYNLAETMKIAIESGDMDGFIECLNSQTELTKKLDTGYMNRNLDFILDMCAGMTAGKMMCGAGGGGFIQIILRKGFSKQDLSTLLRSAFPEQRIDVWNCDFV